jgi:RNA polymerase sigma-70 factor (ECF subfamily)
MAVSWRTVPCVPALEVEAVSDREVEQTDCDGTSIPSDASLMSGIREGDEDAAQALFDRYIVQLQALAERQIGKEITGRVDRDDITQSIFRTLFRRLRGGQYAVPPGESIWRLLTTIALNKIRTVGGFHRAAKRDIRKSATLHEDAAATARHDVGDEASLNILRMTISELMSGMNETQRHIIQLRLENHDVAAIAAQVSCSKRTVERVLQGFRDRLHQVLNDECSE